MITRWTPDLIQQLERANSNITRTISYCIEKNLGIFFTKFSIDTFFSYTKAERRFRKGLLGKFLHSLKLWLKILLC